MHGYAQPPIVRVVLWTLLTCLTGACADHTPAGNGCPSTCGPAVRSVPLEITVPVGASADAIAVSGQLRHNAGSVGYAFSARSGMRLEWSFSGPPAHMVLTYPDGDSDGPFLPPVITLPGSGRYVLALSADTMAEGADGPFRLTLRLLPPD
ncbi:hypothetical protein B0G71_5352 [Paraburkholderia sp. BL27I4N3]|uniref:hypothetical protein n=1 Tax=Paraburkholderia sp. BL27I4N3 TaxID=1938805 RepID=UPI000E27FE6A|nr:hypothetical protein [Paraburkholderia sp. BL27I4N3]REE22146.1 hypothetical protein B0G71_5352 [Paraburkholderia sp. BL27I4N3]